MATSLDAAAAAQPRRDHALRAQPELALERLAAEHPPQQRMLALGWILGGLVSVATLNTSGSTALVLDNLQQFIAVGAVLLACVLSARGASNERQRTLASHTAVGVGLVGIGEVVWWLGDSAAVSVAAGPFFVAGALVALDAIRPQVFRGLDRSQLALVLFDGLIVFLAGGALLAGSWQRYFDPSLTSWSDLVVVGSAVATVSAASAGAFALVARQIAPSRFGPWPALVGLLCAALSWLGWIALAGESSTNAAPTPFDFLFSASVLVFGDGIVSWDRGASFDGSGLHVLRRLREGFPVVAVLLCVGFQFLPGAANLDLAAYGGGGVVLVVLFRQLFLGQLQRQTHESEQHALRALQAEVAERAETALAVADVRAGMTLAETGQGLCDAALRIDGIDVARINLLERSGEVVLLAATGIDEAFRQYLGHPLPPERAALQRSRAAEGAWIDSDYGAADGWQSVLRSYGVRGMTNAPLYWDERLMGVIGLGSRSPTDAAELTRRIPMVREFAAVAAALLGPPLAEREATAASRLAVERTIETGAFSPVFQPIVDLASGSIVGYEALTRFADGRRPDLAFEEAAKIGKGMALEIATLRAALDDATGLPPDAWLSLNVSPQLAGALLPLISVLEGVDRDIVIEITEHVLIDDYARLDIALATLREHVRISVDDAGAGYAGLRHILELAPQFVKLDIALVRSVDSDPARRAMIAAMAAFARETGCSIIAEGIEHEAERAALQELGVTYGQGYLLGRPLVAIECLGADRQAS